MLCGKEKDSFMPSACAPCGVLVHTCSCFVLCGDRFYDSCKLRGFGNVLQTPSCEVDTIFNKRVLSGIWNRKLLLSGMLNFFFVCLYFWQWKWKQKMNDRSHNSFVYQI